MFDNDDDLESVEYDMTFVRFNLKTQNFLVNFRTIGK